MKDIFPASVSAPAKESGTLAACDTTCRSLEGVA